MVGDVRKNEQSNHCLTKAYFVQTLRGHTYNLLYILNFYVCAAFVASNVVVEHSHEFSILTNVGYQTV